MNKDSHLNSSISYNSWMKYLLCLLLPFTLYAQTPVCPPESMVIEFISPTTKAKKAFCGYLKNGETTKHGEEIIFDTNGAVKKRINYNHGVEGEAASTSFVNSVIGTKAKSEEEKMLTTITEMMAILTLKKTDSEQAVFKVSRCDDNPKAWVMGALTKNDIPKSYLYKEYCDVQGSFVASFKSEFVVKFELRNLQDFNQTEMTVKMNVNRSAGGVQYGFEVLEGRISSPTRNANFKAEYQIDIDPLTGKSFKNTQKGKVTLTKLNNLEVNVSAPWAYDR